MQQQEEQEKLKSFSVKIRVLINYHDCQGQIEKDSRRNGEYPLASGLIGLQARYDQESYVGDE